MSRSGWPKLRKMAVGDGSRGWALGPERKKRTRVRRWVFRDGMRVPMSRTSLDGPREVHEDVMRHIEEDVDELADDVLLALLGHGRRGCVPRGRKCRNPRAGKPEQRRRVLDRILPTGDPSTTQDTTGRTTDSNGRFPKPTTIPPRAAVRSTRTSVRRTESRAAVWTPGSSPRAHTAAVASPEPSRDRGTLRGTFVHPPRQASFRVPNEKARAR